MHASARTAARGLGALLVGLVMLTGCGTSTSPPRQPASPVAPYHYRPPQPPGRGPVVVAVGDMACAPGGRVTERTCRDADAADLARQYRPVAVLALGDQQYGTGSLSDYRRAYARTWGRFRSITKPVPGDDAYDGTGYYTYFRRQTRPPGYYAFDVGSWRVYAINDNCTRIDCDAELAWLDQDLRDNPRACSAIMMHTPLYSSGIEHGGNPRVVRPFWRVALRHGVDLSLAGHMHQYERLAPMGLGGRADPDGLTSFVAGTGGKSMRSLTEGRAAHSEQFHNATAGILSLRLGKGRFGWRFRTVDGYNIDAGSQACH